MRRCIALCALLVSGSARAGVDHYRPMAERLAQEGEAYYKQQQPTRALEAYARLFHYDGDYAPAATAMLRTAQILLSQRGPGEVERRYAAGLLLRYVLGTPDTERAARSSPVGIDPVAEAAALLEKLGMAIAPLSSSMGHRTGPDAALPGAKKLVTDATEAAHRAMPAGIERDLGVLRSEWQDPAKKALASLLAARAQLSADQRLALILAACADSRDEGRGYEEPPCAILQKQWPSVGAGLTDKLRPLVTDIDPGWRAISLLLLGKQGGVPKTESPAQRGQFLDDVEHDRKRAEAVLPSFAKQSLQAHKPAFEEVMNGWLEAERAADNPYPLEQRLSLAYRALYLTQGGAGYVRSVAGQDPEPLRRASAAWALACSRHAEDLARFTDKDERVLIALATGVGECADEHMTPVLEPILRSGTPRAVLEAARALNRLSDKNYFRERPEPALRLARVGLLRRDLGNEEVYAYQDLLTTLRSVNDPRVVEVITCFRSKSAYLTEKQLELVYTKATVDPPRAAAFAKGFLEHPDRSIMRLAERIIDRARP